MAFPTLDNTSLVNPSEVPSGMGYHSLQLLDFSKSITTAMLASGYVTAIALMPANVRYAGIMYASATDLDTNGSPALALDLGIRGVSDTTYDDVDCFLDGSTIGQAGTLTSAILFAGAGLLVPVPHYITLTAATAAATAAAGTFKLGIAAVIGTSS